MSTLKVEIWSDFSCPFCYIGKHKFQKALRQFENQDHVQVEFKSFELDPCASKNPGKSIHELLAEKYNMTVEKAMEMNANVAKQAEEVGLTFHFSTIQPTNTFEAHRLAKYATANGKGMAMNERLFKAYFTDSENISDKDTLKNLAEEVGLDQTEVMNVLDSNDYISMVKKDENQAKQIGVTGVPFFVFNEKYAVSGAQSVQTFIDVLEQVWREEQESAKKLQSIPSLKSKTSYCEGGKCDYSNNK